MNVMAGLLFIILFTFSARAEVTQERSAAASTETDFVANCVNVCTRVAENTSDRAKEIFRQNCEAARRDSDEISTLLGASRRAGDIMSKLVYHCAPHSVRKAATGLWDAVASLPGLIAHAFTTNPRTAAERAALQKFYDECSRSAECRRTTARQLVEFRARKPDGSFVVPDSEVDAYLQGMNFRVLQINIQNEIARLRPHCDSLYNFFRQGSLAMNPGDLNLERRREIYNKLVREAPYCPGIISLPPPELEEPPARAATPNTPPRAIDQLSFFEKLSVGYGCLGDKFGEIMWETCSEAGQYLVPIPVGAAVKVGGAVIKSGRLSIAEMRASGALRHIPQGHVPISHVEGGVLTRSIGPDGKISYQVVGPSGIIERQRMDPSGFAISANNDMARALAYDEIASGGKSVMFIDVNNLGLVNYFRQGSEAGDAYLAEVARTIAARVGDNGTVYRWGGDEFMVVYNTTDRASMQAISQGIIDGVSANPTARQLFRAEKVANAATYRAVTSAGSFGELPATFRASLSPAEVAFAQSDFAGFQRIFTTIEQRKIYESAAIQPSVSVGSAVVEGRAPQEALQLANQGANACKITYKTALGMNVCKYTGRDPYLPVTDTGLPVRDLRVQPVAPPTY